MKRSALIAALLALMSQASFADIFDKAESAKDCVQNNNCEKHKWLGRFVAVNKCQKEGNCTDKINDALVRNEDKIQKGFDKVEKINNCANTTDPAVQKECYEMAKAHHRAKQAKKEEAARELQALANERKNLGDSICLSGRIALGIVKVTVKGFVEQINGDNIQIRIADTEGQDVNYKNVSLRPNHIIWDQNGNWIQCKYLGKKKPTRT